MSTPGTLRSPAEAGETALAYAGPFGVFVGCIALEKVLPISPALLYPARAIITLAALLLFSRRVIPWRPSLAVGSVLLGGVVFAVWIGPDLLWPNYRHQWWFQNALTGTAQSSVPLELKSNLVLVMSRVFASVVLVPILEELFWRGWLLRWLISVEFRKIPIGASTPAAFWIVAVLFASEHGSYWDVGLIAGILYNWWVTRTRNLADCILAHAVTNACLAMYVLSRDQWQYWL